MDVEGFDPVQLEFIYRIDGGRYGEVWAARYGAHEIAVKLLGHGRPLPRAAVERVFAEARAMARCRSPHVVVIHGWGHHPRGPVILMERATAGSLASLVESRRGSSGGGLDWTEAMVLAGHIASGLD